MTQKLDLVPFRGSVSLKVVSFEAANSSAYLATLRFMNFSSFDRSSRGVSCLAFLIALFWMKSLPLFGSLNVLESMVDVMNVVKLSTPFDSLGRRLVYLLLLRDAFFANGKPGIKASFIQRPEALRAGFHTEISSIVFRRLQAGSITITEKTEGDEFYGR